MKEHATTIAMVTALFLLLTAIIVLTVYKPSSMEGPAIIGLVSAVSTITGAIAGKQALAAANGGTPPTTPPSGEQTTTVLPH